ncbi:hypothetical protein [Paraburkholderia sp. J67]|uniref:hypothetical protein n=1 Tax=Paraburkholderia sp. J67 TaxID=2805435 RepID=UPI002ABE5BD9|nr:hypothetical protein [Paraburkholderia sp. J67]
MRKMVVVFFAVFSLSFYAINCIADGSVSFSSDIVPILNARPFFEKFIEKTFSVSDVGWGVRIDGPVMPHLGGARMGPYSFNAIWHNADGDVPVVLKINTVTKFFDILHREISGGDLSEARSIEEVLDSIEIDPQPNRGSVNSQSTSEGGK